MSYRLEQSNYFFFFPSKSLDCLLVLLQLQPVLKIWVLLNQPSSSQNVSLLIELFACFSFSLEGSQVAGVQATHWYQCDWLRSAVEMEMRPSSAGLLLSLGSVQTASQSWIRLSTLKLCGSLVVSTVTNHIKSCFCKRD